MTRRCVLSPFSRVLLFATLCTIAHQAPLSIGFSREEYWSELPFPFPMHACMHAKSLQSCPILCDPKDSSPPGPSVHEILQARILEWVAISFSNAFMHAKLLQSCPTLCDPRDGSPPGFSRQEYWSGLPFSSLKNGIDDLICKGEIETQM